MKLAKKVVCSLVIPLTLALTTPTLAPARPTAEIHYVYKNLEQGIDGLLARYSTKKTDIGIKVVSLKDGKILYEREADKQLIPASNLKLLTSLVALKKLGANYKFKTEFYTDGEIKEGVLDGNLYVKGYGDPSLVSEELWLIVKDLHNKGIKEIKGDIIADDTYFDKERHSPGWYETVKHYEYSRPFNAPNGALSLNFNTITVHVKPAKNVKEKPTIVLDPETKYLDVDNRAQTFPSYDKVTVLREESNSKDFIGIYGGISVNSGEKVFMVNISKPDEYFINVFKEFLEKRGIKVGGELKNGVVPEEAKLVLTHKSKPLSLIVRDLCKYSNNFIADQLVKTLDAEINQKQGTNKGGVKIIEDYMKGLGLKDYEIVDGSGLSNKNKLTAETVIKVLKEAYDDFEIGPEFVSALPRAGEDGTLEGRMYYLKGKTRGKTGTLSDSGASTISGYVKTKDDVLVFSILMNSEDLKVWQMIYLQDRIIEELARQ